jgi:hypothetical protein
MALYKNSGYLTQSNDTGFDKLYKPGAKCPVSGIYRCEGCGDEIASNKDNPFPTQNQQQHKPSSGAIEWRLIVRSESKD